PSCGQTVQLPAANESGPVTPHDTADAHAHEHEDLELSASSPAAPTDDRAQPAASHADEKAPRVSIELFGKQFTLVRLMVSVVILAALAVGGWYGVAMLIELGTQPAASQPQAQGAGAQQNQSSGGYLQTLGRALKRGQATATASQMRQVAILLRQYAEDHNELPEDLAALKQYIGDSEYQGLMTHPVTNEQPGYIYEKPAPDADPTTTPILWEARAGVKYLDGPVLYADGHIDLP
ncbi:MAG: type II secretion system protein, partial [Phycisphaeraceae bacterium]